MNTLKCNSKNWLIAVAVLALMTTGAAPARAESKTPDLHFLAVGVSKVPSLPESMQLRFAHKDAQDLAKVWQTQKGGLYRNVSGEVLTNESAKLSDILAALDRLDANSKSGDTAVVSFAGHGGVAGRRVTNWFFVASDFDPAKGDQTVLYEWMLRERLAKLTQRGVTVILVLDTCHSGAFGSADSGILLIAACSIHQESFEDDLHGNGLFTRALIEALQGKADANRDGVVTLAEIEAYLAKRVAQMHSQNPSFDQDGRRVEQSPIFNQPISILRTIPLAGGNIAAPTTGQDRFRIGGGR